MQLGPNQKAWVAALRSGNYKQGAAGLEPVNGRYCCLGVACSVAEGSGVHVDRYDENMGRIKGPYLKYQWPVMDYIRLRNEFGEPGFKYAEEIDDYLGLWFGVKQRDTVRGPYSLSLIALNDTLELTFEQIAEVLEAFPEAYFEESV